MDKNNDNKKAKREKGKIISMSDGGLETKLCFECKIDLPHFASFPLLFSNAKLLEDIYGNYYDLCLQKSIPFVYETPTWRASSDYCKCMEYDVNEVTHQAVLQAVKFKTEREKKEKSPIKISGVLGPRFDGYLVPKEKMTASQAEEYHSIQVQAFAKHRKEIDYITAYTLNYSEEALGIVNACKALQFPCVISFTLETNGRLASGEELSSVIKLIDEKTDSYPLFYGINCCHPTHFMEILVKNDAILKERLRALRPNSSKLSHEQLNESTELDEGKKKRINDGKVFKKKI